MTNPDVVLVLLAGIGATTVVCLFLAALVAVYDAGVRRINARRERRS